MENRKPTHELISRTGKGVSKWIHSKEYENAVILDCEKSRTTISDVKQAFDQAIEEKRPLIIESIDLLVKE